MKNKFGEISIKASLAGCMIALGGFAFLSVSGGALGALLFSIGLLSVCIFGLYLYTGKINYCFNEEFKIYEYALILLFNLIGAYAIGLLVHFYSPQLIEYATKVVNTKIIKSSFQVYMASIFCNICIFIAVHTWKLYKNYIGIAMIIFSVVVFILIGGEHCIANIFYIGVSGNMSWAILKFMLFNILGNTCGGIIANLCLNAITSMKENT